MNQRLQPIPVALQKKLIAALPPDAGEVRILSPVREKRRSLALQEYAKRNRGSVVVCEFEGGNDLPEQNGPLRSLGRPDYVPTLVIGVRELAQPAGLEHLLEDPLEQRSQLSVGEHAPDERNESSNVGNGKETAR